MIDEKTKIEHFDILLKNIDDIGRFNISLTLEKGMAINSDNLKKEDLGKFLDLVNAVENFGIAHRYFIETYPVTYRLTEKGIEAKDFGGHLKYQKALKKTPLTSFQKLQLVVMTLSLIAVIVLGILNYSLARDKSDLKDENTLLQSENAQLKSDFVLYKDSINGYKEKALQQTKGSE